MEAWLDSFNLVPGQQWQNAIKQAISRSSYFIALLSSRSVEKRGHVQKEIRQALDIADQYPEEKLFILPVRIEECEASFERIRDLHSVDLFPKYEDGLSRLLRVLGYVSKEKPKLSYIEKYKRAGTIMKVTDRGFGFIRCALFEHKKDIFFHHNELCNVSFEELREGDSIIFTLASGEGIGLAALNVEKV